MEISYVSSAEFACNEFQRNKTHRDIHLLTAKFVNLFILYFIRFLSV